MVRISRGDEVRTRVIHKWLLEKKELGSNKHATFNIGKLLLCIRHSPRVNTNVICLIPIRKQKLGVAYNSHLCFID